MAYYVLTGVSEWTPGHIVFFSDYDRESVVFERECVKRDGGVDYLRIYRLTCDSQEAIDNLVKRLNNGS